MRCIEIVEHYLILCIKSSININMRCIEIESERLLSNPLARLTLTWDVLKLLMPRYSLNAVKD